MSASRCASKQGLVSTEDEEEQGFFELDGWASFASNELRWDGEGDWKESGVCVSISDHGKNVSPTAAAVDELRFEIGSTW